MKRFLSFILFLAMVCSAFPTFVFNTSAAMPDADALDGYENVCLTYTYRPERADNGRHYTEDLLPYVAYLDTEGNIKDFFFDSYLFLPCVTYGPSGARYHADAADPTLAIDWTTYVEDTFYEGANVDALDEAFGIAKSALGNTEKKAGVFFTILYPCDTAETFGTLGGRYLNFSRMDDRKYAIKWMIDEQLKRFYEAGYENLDVVGFYWLEEYVYQLSDVELFNYASDYLHSLGLKFIWIPWYCANGYYMWEDLGFDVACMQPNYYWMQTPDEYRVEDSIFISDSNGMSMEIELDHRAKSGEYYNRYLKYLEEGMKGGAMDSIKMYYQDGKTGVYYSACYSGDPLFRSVYDLTYKYAKGTLRTSDINYVMTDEFELPNGVDWVSIGKPYSGCESFVDGNGAEYQQVSGRELTDGVIGDTELGTEWHAFHVSILDEDGRMSTVIDLGEVRNDLTHFIAHFNNHQLYSIGVPTDIEIYVSADGENFRLIAEPGLNLLDNVSYSSYITTEPISARYVKLSLTDDGFNYFVFCSEFYVGAKVVEPTPDEAVPDVSDEPVDSDEPNTSDTVVQPEYSDYDDSLDEPNVSDNSDITDTSNPPDLSYEPDDSNESGGHGESEALDTTVPPDDKADDSDEESTLAQKPEKDEDDKPQEIPPVKDDFILGDITENGEIDSLDYILLKRSYFGTYKLTDIQKRYGDITENGEIDSLDYILLKRMYFGTYKKQ